MTSHLRHIVYVLVIVFVNVLPSCNLEEYAFRKKLALAAPVLNTQCPIDVPYGSLQRIYVEHDTLCTLIKATQGLNVTALAEHSDLLAHVILITLAEDTTQRELDSLLCEMGTYHTWLRIRVDETPTSNKTAGLKSIWLYASPALLDSVFSGRYSERERARYKVQLQVALAKTHMPYKVNDQMTMTAIDYMPGEVRMDYTVIEDEQVNLGRKDFRTTAELFIRQRIWKDLIKAKKASTQEVVKQYYLAGCRVRYTCTGATSGGQVQVVFTQGDLRMILSHYGMHL